MAGFAHPLFDLTFDFCVGRRDSNSIGYEKTIGGDYNSGEQLTPDTKRQTLRTEHAPRPSPAGNSPDKRGRHAERNRQEDCGKKSYVKDWQSTVGVGEAPPEVRASE